MTNLKWLRMAHNLTQKQLSDLLCLKVGELSKFENGWYAKVPERVEAALKQVFGPSWTFETLMLEAPAPSAPPLPGRRRRSRSKSAQGEKRAAA